jgi:hypothetical protein
MVTPMIGRPERLLASSCKEGAGLRPCGNGYKAMDATQGVEGATKVSNICEDVDVSGMIHNTWGVKLSNTPWISVS